MQPSLVIFDMDGVLVDTTPCHRSAYAELWEHLEIDGPEYESIAGRKTSEVVAEAAAALQPTKEQILSWVEFKQSRARDLLRTQPIVFPDTNETLRTLSERGFMLALASAASRRGVDIVLDRLQAHAVFAAIVTGDDVEHGKPSPQIYQATLKLASTSAGDALVVEDSISGVRAALSAGISTASVRTGVESDDDLFVGCFDSLKAFCDYLQGST